MGALSVVAEDGNGWELLGIPLTHQDIDLRSFALDGGIIDPNLDALGFYRNGQLDMDQVNHHVHLALDHLHHYDNKGNRNRCVNTSTTDTGPSWNGQHAPTFNPFKVAPKMSTSTSIIPTANIQPTMSVSNTINPTPPSIAINNATPTMTPITPPTTSTSTQARKAPVAHREKKKEANEDTHMDDDIKA